MKTLIISTLFVVAHVTCKAQAVADYHTPKRNTIYVEAFGQGIYNSLSFDRLYRLDKKVKSSLTVGVTLIPLLNKPDHLLVVGMPVSYNWLFGKKDHHFELGIGLTALNITEKFDDNSTSTWSIFYMYMTPKFSYRYQRTDGGLFFRVSFTPPVGLMEKDTFGSESYFPYANTPFGYRAFPWPGVSLGWTMK